MGKVAIVTGSGRGIGRAIALALAHNGYSLVLNVKKNMSEGAETLKLVNDVSEGILVQADAGVLEGARKIVSETIQRFEALDTLVNNAGLGIAKPLIEMEETLWDKQVTVNLKSAYLCMREAIPFMLKREGGRIVNISSVAGLHGLANLSAYSASKAGVIGLTKSVAAELSGSGITVNAIAAGLVKTRMGDSLLGFIGVNDDEWAKSNTLTQKLIQPEEVAALVCYLVSDKAKNITGQVFVIDSGSSIIPAKKFLEH
jgi:3-oxoacyl-[acyl-carrier protein] reductase